MGDTRKTSTESFIAYKDVHMYVVEIPDGYMGCESG